MSKFLSKLAQNLDRLETQGWTKAVVEKPILHCTLHNYFHIEPFFSKSRCCRSVECWMHEEHCKHCLSKSFRQTILYCKLLEWLNDRKTIRETMKICMKAFSSTVSEQSLNCLHNFQSLFKCEIIMNAIWKKKLARKFSQRNYSWWQNLSRQMLKSRMENISKAMRMNEAWNSFWW